MIKTHKIALRPNRAQRAWFYQQCGYARFATDAHHKATTEIVTSASKIGIETLQVRNLLKNKHLAKALSDSALGGFLEKLKTKAEARGIPIVQADRFFASSKTCSTCGHKKDDLTLSDRTYTCSNCGISIDRDVNAAINLKHVAVGYTET